MNHPNRQLVPAPGWYAVFLDTDGHYVRPLVCFEVSYNAKSLNPYTAVGLFLFIDKLSSPETTSKGLFRDLEYADQIEGFIGYLPPGKDLQEWLMEN